MAELLEIELSDPDDFLVIKETLTRMGIDLSEDNKKVLEQSCHILHKKNRYYILHTNELLSINGIKVILSMDDIIIRNTIASLLSKWGLCYLEDENIQTLPQSDGILKVVPFKDKKSWLLTSRVQAGKRGAHVQVL